MIDEHTQDDTSNVIRQLVSACFGPRPGEQELRLNYRQIATMSASSSRLFFALAGTPEVWDWAQHRLNYEVQEFRVYLLNSGSIIIKVHSMESTPIISAAEIAALGTYYVPANPSTPSNAALAPILQRSGNIARQMVYQFVQPRLSTYTGEVSEEE